MNTKRLVDLVYESFPRSEKISKRQVNDVVEKTLDFISKEIIKENTVNLYGFGSFVVSYRASRLWINPQTYESMQLPPVKTIRFKPATKTKKLLNNK